MNPRRNFDLNLLVIFDALMAERHVSRAAERVFLSQSAMSHALNRLRQQFVPVAEKQRVTHPLFSNDPALSWLVAEITSI